MHPPKQLLAAKIPRARVPALLATASRLATPKQPAKKKAAATGQLCASLVDQARLTSRKNPTIALRSLGGAIASETKTANVATATSKTVDGDRERIEVKEMNADRTASDKAAGVIARATVRTTEAGTVTRLRKSPNGSTSR